MVLVAQDDNGFGGTEAVAAATEAALSERLERRAGLHGRDAQMVEVRQSLLDAIRVQGSQMHGIKYILQASDGPKQTIVSHEITSDTMKLPEGQLLSAARRWPFSEPALTTEKLAACLRATFKRLGIAGDVLELDEGVFVSNETINAIVEWAKEQPYNGGTPNSGPVPARFALAFNQAAEAQERGRR